jgi:hypothetical protein
MYIDCMNHIDNLEFLKNKDNELVASIYPLNKVVMENETTIKRLGGSVDKIDISERSKGSRFDGLGVPVGLFISKKHINHVVAPGKTKDAGPIDETEFSRLLDNVAIRPSKKNSLKKRKNINNKQKFTKRV